jgi:hypothetical protein
MGVSAVPLSVDVLVVLAYAGLTILIPKLDVGGVTFYITEPLFFLAVLSSLAYAKYRIVGAIDRTYLLFCAMSFFAFWEGYFYTGLLDLQSAARIVKYVVYAAMLSFGVLYRDRITERNVRNIITIQIFFVAVAGLYVLFNIARLHPSAVQLIWSYSNQFRLVGMTGYVIQGAHLALIGTTSVSMGVFIAFIGLLCTSFYGCTRRSRYLVAAAVVAIGELLTFSRTGLVVLLMGWSYMAWINRHSRRLLQSIVAACLIIASLMAVFGTKEVLQLASLGSLLRFSSSQGGLFDASTNQRISYLVDAVRYIEGHPLSLLFGTGYGENYTYALIGTPHLESLIMTTLFQCGIFTTIILIVHFYAIWRSARQYRKSSQKDLWSQIMAGIEAFVPGFFVANLIGGNSLQTDFFAPLFYFLIGISLAKLRSMNGLFRTRHS